VTSTTVLHQAALRGITPAGVPVQLRNTSQRVLFATLANRGVPAAGDDAAASAGLALDIQFVDDAGEPVDITRLQQGTDVVAQIAVRNQTPLQLDNIALTQIVPAGWEIANERLENATAAGTRDGADGSGRGAGAVPAGVGPDFVDVRDDRVLQYFSLKSGETIRFRTRLTAAYLGRYYLPSVSAEAMYDASKNARSRGQWVQVVPRSP
jgi:alpha-2-macroglobulin